MSRAVACTSETVAGGVTRRDGSESLGRGSAIDTPLALIHLGEATIGQAATARSGFLTKSQVVIPKAPSPGPDTGPAGQPDVAVKADDHEWLVATVVQVLPAFCGSAGRAQTDDVGSVWR
jgi:hypothetical protein